MLTELQVLGTRDVPALPIIPGQLPGDDYVQIKEIDGLGPVGAKISTAPLAVGVGAVYRGASVGFRDVTITFGFKPDWVDKTYASLRQEVYRYFLPGQEVTLRFKSDELEEVEITGYVETLEPSIFSKDPEIKVSILCMHPYFRAVTPRVLTGFMGLAGLPSDEVSYTKTFTYPGTSPVGYTLRIEDVVNPPINNQAVVVRNIAPYVATFSVLATVNAGQFIKIDSRVGEKTADLVTASNLEKTGLLGAVVATPHWPQLNPGVNKVYVSSSRRADWELTYYPEYAGL